ncbi:MAG TPA: polysaccharide deacetylase family protein [Phenylobacterium sp.]|nr:polysaccharide deacetylase family protein [Phenylobacterium sp.]
MSPADAYQPDRSLKGKLRRRLVRLAHRRPVSRAPSRPMISFTFDDAPLSATTTGAAILEQRGLRGVYYVSAGLAGQDGPMGRYAEAADYRRLAEGGHEIACHTFSHLDCGQAGERAASADVDRNAETLAAWGLPAPASFAYPYGDVSGGPKAALEPLFGSLRALHHGVVTAGSDLNQLPAVGIEGAEGEAVARRWLGEAARRKAWLILYTHDVAETPSPWGCTPDALANLADEALALGFDVVTAAEAVERLRG